MSKKSGWSRTKSATSRGYGYAWQKVRNQVIERDNGYCVPCLANGRHRQATAVDHIRPKAEGGTDAMNNLQSICTECHRVKSLTDRGYEAKSSGECDTNGTPVDPDHPWNK